MDQIKILIVEDESIIALHIEQILQQQGYNVVGLADNGKSVLQCIEKDKPDLILMDIIIKGDMDGIDTTIKVKEKYDIPIIYLTAHSDETTLKRAKATEPHGYILKPINQNDVYSTIEIAFYRHSMEKKLKESEERFRRLSENAKDMIFRMRLPGGEYDYISPAAVEITGYTVEEIMSTPMHVATTIHPDWRAFLESEWINICNGKTSDYYEFKIIHKSGSERWLNQRNVIVFDENRKPIAIEGIVTDVTDQKRIQDAVFKSEAKYRALIETTGTGFAIFNGNGALVDANDEYLKLTGYKHLDDILGRHVVEWTADYDKKRNEEEVKECMKTGIVRDLEVDYQWPDGTIVPVEVNATVLISDEGAQILSLCRDITERRKSQEDLHRAQALLNAAIEASPAGILIAEAPEVNIMLANSAALGIRGANGETLTDIPMDLHPQNWQTFYPDGEPFKPEDLPLSRAILNGEKTENVAVVIRRPNGDERWVLANSAPVKDTDGNVTAAVVVFPDITEMKQAEWDLQESERRFRSIFEQAPIGIVQSTLNGQFVNVNKTFCNFIGYDTEEILALDYKAITYSEDVESSNKYFKSVVNQNKVLLPLEKRYIRKDGTIFWGRMTLSLINNEDGKPNYTLGIIEDITEQKKIREELLESEERYRTLFEESADAINIMDEERYIDCNRASLNLFGIKNKTEFVGLFPYEISPPLQTGGRDSKALAEKQIKYAFEKGSNNFEWIHKKSNGKEFFTNVMLTAFKFGEKNYLQAVVRDITDLKVAEKTIMESERRLFQIIQGNFIPTFVIDKDHIVTHWNRACEIITGVSSSEIVGTKNQWQPFYSKKRPVLADLIIDDKLDKVEKYYKNKFGESNVLEGIYEVEDYFPNLKGNGKWLYFAAAQLRDVEGNIIGAIETFQDITDRKLAEKALMESEEKYRLLFENAEALVGVIAKDGTILMINRIAAEYMNGKANDFINRSADKLKIRDTSIESIKRRISKVIKTGNSSEYEDYIKFPKKTCWLLTNMQPVQDAEGKIYAVQIVSYDITDRKNAEMSVRESEQRLFQIIQQSIIPMFVINSDHEVTHWNRACEILTGTSAMDLIGKKETWIAFYEKQQPILADLVMTRDIDKIEKYYSGKYRKSEIIEDAYTVEDFYPSFGEDGKWLYFGAAPLRDVNGEIIGAVEFFQDITNRKNAEVAVRESEQRLFQIIYQSSIPIVVLDKDHIVTHWNKSMEEITNVPAENVLYQKYPWEVLYGEKRPLLADLILDQDIDGINKYYKDKWKKSDTIKDSFEGEDFLPSFGEDGKWVYFGASPLRDPNGNIVGAIEFLQDITDRKEAENSLKLSEEKFSKAFLSSPYSMVIFEMQTGRILEMNDQFLDLLGYTREDVLLKTVRELNFFQDIKKLDEINEIIDQDLGMKNIEVIFTTSTGENRLASVSGEKIQIGERDCFLTMIEDITEMRRLQKEISMVIEQERQRIGSDLHDDLGQLLTGATFLIQSLKHEFTSKKYEETDEIIKIEDLIREAVMKTRSLSKMLSPVELGENGLIAALEEMVKQIQKVFLITCTIHQNGVIDIRDNLVGTSLYYIAREAVNNALKHSSARNIDINLSSENDGIIMIIEDDGKGMQKNPEEAGIGLHTMRYRADIIGAQINYRYGDRKGFAVEVIINH